MRRYLRKRTYISDLGFLVLASIAITGIAFQFNVETGAEYLLAFSIVAGCILVFLFIAMFVAYQHFNHEKKLFAAANIEGMSGREFEEYIAYVLRQIGFRNVRLTPATGDFGTDLIATKDGVSFAIQTKRHKKSINNSAVQQAVAGKEYYKCDMAMVVTNSTYTRQAREQATRSNVVLIDGQTLKKWIVDAQKTQ